MRLIPLDPSWMHQILVLTQRVIQPLTNQELGLGASTRESPRWVSIRAGIDIL